MSKATEVRLIKGSSFIVNEDSGDTWVMTPSVDQPLVFRKKNGHVITVPWTSILYTVYLGNEDGEA